MPQMIKITAAAIMKADISLVFSLSDVLIAGELWRCVDVEENSTVVFGVVSKPGVEYK